MVHFDQLELSCVGAAAVVDTVLLLALTRRRNLRYVSVPIILLALGAWLWHAGDFLHLLFYNWNSVLAEPHQWAAMMGMTAGLLLMPSAVLHGLWRLTASGLEPPGEYRSHFALAYLLLIFLVPAGVVIAAHPLSPYLDLMRNWLPVYAISLALANAAAAVGLAQLRGRLRIGVERQFALWMAIALALLSVMQSYALLYAYPAWPEWRPIFVLVVVLSPLIFTALFTYFVIQFNFMRLVLEQSILYGAVLVGVMLFHRLLAHGIGPAFQARYQVDLALLEMLLVLGAVLVYFPYAAAPPNRFVT